MDQFTDKNYQIYLCPSSPVCQHRRRPSQTPRNLLRNLPNEQHLLHPPKRLRRKNQKHQENLRWISQRQTHGGAQLYIKVITTIRTLPKRMDHCRARSVTECIPLEGLQAISPLPLAIPPMVHLARIYQMNQRLQRRVYGAHMMAPLLPPHPLEILQNLELAILGSMLLGAVVIDQRKIHLVDLSVGDVLALGEWRRI